jgi:UDP-N-acetylmuramyl pentapeptide synthase
MQFLKTIIVGILTLESRLILRKYKPFIVAITGSVGKTSTKDAIFDVLKSHSSYVRKSDKSMNSEIGLPITIIGVSNAWRNIFGWVSNMWAGLQLIVFTQHYPDCLVLEIGADHPGDIKRVGAWLKPDITVITQISDMPVHVEFFNSPEQVRQEKAELVKALKVAGTLVLFGDNPKVVSLADMIKAKNPQVVLFGLTEGVQVQGSAYQNEYEQSSDTKHAMNHVRGFSFVLSMGEIQEKISVEGVIGPSLMYSLLAAAAVGRARGIPAHELVKGLQSYHAPRGRMNIISGIKGSTLIDDTYNSSPDAVVSALLTLKSIEHASRRVAVLGDMMELGKYSGDEHRKIGVDIVGSADMLVTVGQRSYATARMAVQSGMSATSVVSFDTASEAAEYMSKQVKSGDIILIKGSQSVRMERVVARLMLNPERAPDLLVRQEKEWLEKK